MVGQPTNCDEGSRSMSADQAALSEPHRRLTPPAATAPGPLRTIVAFAAREASLLWVLALYGVIVLGSAPYELVQDSWLTLVSGREVVTNGLPRVDTLTAWTLGVQWVDQQWLAQSLFYGLHVLGGIKLVLLFHAIALVGTAALGLQAARSLGASRRSVWLGAAICLPLAPWALQMRSQTLAVPLFVALLWLLASDSRKPSGRVLLALPLLVLWANLHGTVVLGVALVCLRGLTAVAAAVRGATPAESGKRGAILLAAAPACLLASPYGIDLVGYYHSLLLNPMLKSLIEEWGVSSPSKATALFYIVAFATVALLARQRARLTGFEQLALLSMLAVAISSLRSIVWFALAASLFVPLLLDGELPREAQPRRSLPPARALLGVSALAWLAIVSAVVALQPQSWYTSQWPDVAAARVGALAAAKPDALVLADDGVADWLLWEQPQLAGRVAHDVRFELFSERQFRQLSDFRKRTGRDWSRLADRYDILALDPVRSAAIARDLRGFGGYRKVFEDDLVLILARP